MFFQTSNGLVVNLNHIIRIPCTNDGKVIASHVRIPMSDGSILQVSGNDANTILALLQESDDYRLITHRLE
jgi:hypothetical protein